MVMQDIARLSVRKAFREVYPKEERLRLKSEEINNSDANKKKTISNFYETDAWRELRFKVLRKFKFECMACGRSKKKHGVVIHVDHIKPRSKFPELELDLNNLQVLCEDCNLGKRNFSEEDLRP